MRAERIFFFVQVKGTTLGYTAEEHRLRVRGFVVNVRENKAFYAWVAEPRVEAKGVTLRFHETGPFHPLDSAVVSDIIDRVKAWSQALPNLLMPA